MNRQHHGANAGGARSAGTPAARNAERLPRRASLETLAAELAALDVAAREYDANLHGGLDVVAAYTTPAGRTRRVCVNYHPEAGSWRVIDVAEDGSANLVARMAGAGAEELRGAAVTQAIEYAEQWRRFVSGARRNEPVADPQPMPMTYREG